MQTNSAALRAFYTNSSSSSSSSGTSGSAVLIVSARGVSVGSPTLAERLLSILLPYPDMHGSSGTSSSSGSASSRSSLHPSSSLFYPLVALGRHGASEGCLSALLLWYLLLHTDSAWLDSVGAWSGAMGCAVAGATGVVLRAGAAVAGRLVGSVGRGLRRDVVGIAEGLLGLHPSLRLWGGRVGWFSAACADKVGFGVSTYFVSVCALCGGGVGVGF